MTVHLVIVLDAVAEVVLRMSVGVHRFMSVAPMSTSMSTAKSTTVSTTVSASKISSSKASTANSSGSKASAKLWQTGDEGRKAESKQTDEEKVELKSNEIEYIDIAMAV